MILESCRALVRQARPIGIVAVTAMASACGAVRSAGPVAPEPPVVKALSATRFVAFGDSLTEGFLQACPDAPAPVVPEIDSPRGPQGLREGTWSPISYPARLQALLASRYPHQSVEVVNEGVGGEVVASGASELTRVLIGDNPEVLLLLEGINDINFRQGAAIPDVVEQLRSMIRMAKRRGVTVFVGTLLPQREGACRSRDAADSVNDVIPANMAIRSMVGEEGAILVDLFRVFNGRTAVLIGPDGLHPTAAGYQAMADAFFAAIRTHLEDE
jgi:lysophospholipase L1-like esterase